MNSINQMDKEECAIIIHSGYYNWISVEPLLTKSEIKEYMWDKMGAKMNFDNYVAIGFDNVKLVKYKAGDTLNLHGMVTMLIYLEDADTYLQLNDGSIPVVEKNCHVLQLNVDYRKL
jgi:hypothetical protein